MAADREDGGAEAFVGAEFLVQSVVGDLERVRALHCLHGGCRRRPHPWTPGRHGRRLRGGIGRRWWWLWDENGDGGGEPLEDRVRVEAAARNTS